jgi:hypothetical protein
MRIDLSPRAGAALRKRGGHLFIWRDQAGMLHARTSEPRAFVSFERIENDDLVFYIESDIEPPKRWVVTFTLFPWPHFVPFHDPPEEGSAGNPILDHIPW